MKPSASPTTSMKLPFALCMMAKAPRHSLNVPVGAKRKYPSLTKPYVKSSFQERKYPNHRMTNTNNELLEKSLWLAIHAHMGQVDKAGASYIFHPIRVSCKCSTDEERIVALLHDTIEDTNITADYLLGEGFPRNIVDAILSVTRNEDESYKDFIRRCSLNPIGRQVKLHDLEDNMDISRLPQVTEKDLARLNKYINAYRYLKE